MSESRILTVFGGSSPTPTMTAYQQAERLGELAARSGWTVATGGYSGTMEAVSKGAAQAGGSAIGVTCQEIEAWRPLGANPWVSREIRCQSLRDRLEKLVEIGQAAIALPGGIGTLAEVALTWSWLQTSVISSKPLILVGHGWRQTMEIFLDSFPSYVDPKYIELLGFADEVSQAWSKVLEQLDNASH